MKLLCVNAKELRIRDVLHKGVNLKEGQVYETKAKSFTDEYGNENYYIEGLGSKLKCRFAELLDDDDSINQAFLEEQLELALQEEDYLAAEEIKRQLNKE